MWWPCDCGYSGDYCPVCNGQPPTEDYLEWKRDPKGYDEKRQAEREAEARENEALAASLRERPDLAEHLANLAVFPRSELRPETRTLTGDLYRAGFIALDTVGGLHQLTDAGKEIAATYVKPDFGVLTMRHLVKYPDCNATKNLFGGKMLAWIDEGAAMFAACQMHTDHLVTRKMGEVEFRVPVPLGSVCTVYARTKKEGRTSLTVTVTVTRKKFAGAGEEVVVCEADVVFVALDEDNRSTPWKR